MENWMKLAYAIYTVSNINEVFIKTLYGNEKIYNYNNINKMDNYVVNKNSMRLFNKMIGVNGNRL